MVTRDATVNDLWVKTDPVPVYPTIQYEINGAKWTYDPEYCLELGSTPPDPGAPDFVYRYFLAIETEHAERSELRREDVEARDFYTNAKERCQAIRQWREKEIERRKAEGEDFADILEPYFIEKMLKAQLEYMKQARMLQDRVSAKKLKEIAKQKQPKLKFKECPCTSPNMCNFLKFPLTSNRKRKMRRNSSSQYFQLPEPADPCPFRC